MSDTLGKTIATERNAKGMTQDELARKAGISRLYLSQLETGKKPVGPALAEELFKALSLPLKKLDHFFSMEDFWKDADFIKNRRSSEQISTALGRARNSIKLQGIALLGTTHSGREEIQRVLDSGGNVKVCMLNPESAAFRLRQEQECRNQKTGKSSQRLWFELHTSLEILREINMFKKAGKLEVRLSSEYPRFFAAVIDGSFLFYNQYVIGNDESGEGAAVQRGGLGKNALFSRSNAQEFFGQISSIMQVIWEAAEPFDLDGPGLFPLGDTIGKE